MQSLGFVLLLCNTEVLTLAFVMCIMACAVCGFTVLLSEMLIKSVFREIIHIMMQIVHIGMRIIHYLCKLKYQPLP